MKIKVLKQIELEEIYKNLNTFQVPHKCPACEVIFYVLMMPVLYEDDTETGELAYLLDFNPRCKFCGNIIERMDMDKPGGTINKIDMIKDTA